MAGQHLEPAALPRRVLLDLVGERRPRPDQAHLAAHNVPQLRQLVDRAAPQEAAAARDPRVALVHGVAGPEPLGVLHHRAQLEQLELDAVLADALLPEEDGAAILELDGEGGEGERRCRQDEAEAGAEDVEGALHAGLNGSPPTSPTREARHGAGS